MFCQSRWRATYKPSVLMINPLREAITRAAAWRGVELLASEKRLVALFLMKSVPSRVSAMPRDSRSLEIAQAPSANPDDGRRSKNGSRPACHHACSRTIPSRNGF